MLNEDDVQAALRNLEAKKAHLKAGQDGPELPKPSHLVIKQREKAVAYAERHLAWVRQEAEKAKQQAEKVKQ